MRRRSLVLQAGVAAGLIALLALLVNNLTVNLLRTGLGLDFTWLGRPAGFALAESALPFQPSDSYLWALTVGWLNSLKVIGAGLVLATLLGVAAGAARSSGNRLLRSLAGGYVALIRQVPLLLQLLFWYFVAFLGLPETPIGGLIQLSNQGDFPVGSAPQRGVLRRIDRPHGVHRGLDCGDCAGRHQCSAPGAMGGLPQPRSE